jgi:hypothetical protein
VGRHGTLAYVVAEKALASGSTTSLLADPSSGRLSFYNLRGDENQKIFPYLKPIEHTLSVG